MLRKIISSGVLLFATSLAVQTKSLAQTPADTGIILIRTSRLFDSEHGSMLEGMDILVRRGVIDSVGASIKPPRGARIIDLSKFTVLPGLIDAHTHLLYLEQPTQGAAFDNVKTLVMDGTASRALHAAARARTFLAAGITTVRDLGNSGRFGDVALRDAIRDGSVDGPRMFVSGPGLSPVGGQLPGLRPEWAGIAEDEYRIVHSPDDAADAVRENVTFGAQLIKVYSNNTPNPAFLSLEELRAIVAAAQRLGVRVAAHATDDASVWRAAEAGVTSVEHAYEVSDSTLALMARKGVFLVATDLDSLSAIRYAERAGMTGDRAGLMSFLKSERARLRRAVAAGVPIAAGSDNYIDMQWPQGEAARRVLFAYQQTGLTPVQILQAATINDARLLGQEGRLGVLKAGAFADLIAVEGNPLTDFSALERIRFVMKNGTVYVGR
ncbi:MAG: amidohydrolase family protein [Gemmatimonadota bacterium]